MKTILLYAPDVNGHPRVYCRAIADAMDEAPCRLILAMGFRGEERLETSPDVAAIRSRPSVRVLNTSLEPNAREGHLTAEGLVRLQATLGVDVTVFIEADKFHAEFERIARGSAPRLHGRNLAIFAETSAWYPGEDPYTGQRLRILGPTVRRTLGNIRRRINSRRAGPRAFYEQVLLRKRLVDEVLVKDERLAEWHGVPVVWMPEISRPLLGRESTESLAETARRRVEVEAFLGANGSREPLLYFGDAAYYKGYDLFLAYVAAHGDTCALHAGRRTQAIEAARFERDVAGLREQLVREGRIYEMDAYVASQSMKELFFRSVRMYVTTHRLALSSATMIQAAEFGRPVVVPDRGLLTHRVRTHGLGAVYRYEDLEDLNHVVRSLRQQDLGCYAPRLASFYARFSDDAIRAFWRERLLAHGGSTDVAPR